MVALGPPFGKGELHNNKKPHQLSLVGLFNNS